MKFEDDTENKTAEETAANENITYNDGTYEGTGKGNNGDIKVSVTVSGGKISEVKVVEHIETEAIYGTAEEPVIKAIVENNSTKVDTVAGATKSSKGIIAAVVNALEQAK